MSSQSPRILRDSPVAIRGQEQDPFLSGTGQWGSLGQCLLSRTICWRHLLACGHFRACWALQGTWHPVPDTLWPCPQVTACTPQEEKQSPMDPDLFEDE